MEKLTKKGLEGTQLKTIALVLICLLYTSAALGFCAEGEKKQLILQGNTELRGAVHDSRKVFCTFKAIDAPFHTIGAQCGKLGSFFKNGGFRGLYNRNNNFGAALADAAAADVDTGHGASPL